MKWIKEIEHDGDSQQIVGKTIESFRMSADREDFEFVFDDKSELRIFGKAMHPSFLGVNAKDETSESTASTRGG